jgi:hypothetical protein
VDVRILAVSDIIDIGDLVPKIIPVAAAAVEEDFWGSLFQLIQLGFGGVCICY